jgi:uncharacterized protein YkwD
MRSMLRRPVVVLPLVCAILAGCEGKPLSSEPFVFGGGTGGSIGSVSGSGAGSGGSGSVASQIIALENQQRTTAGLKTLSENAALDRAAALLCSEIAQAGTYALDLPGTQYPTGTDRLAAVGYKAVQFDEGVTESDDGSPSFILNDVMSASDSRGVILDADMTEIGVAQQANVVGHICTAQVLGTR